MVNEKDGLDQRAGAAYHEAGHAVVSLLLTLPFESISIVESDKSLGQIVAKADPGFRPDLALNKGSASDIRQHIIIGWAGLLAEFGSLVGARMQLMERGMTGKPS